MQISLAVAAPARLMTGLLAGLMVYPQADHAFNLPNSKTLRKDDAADAWRRTSTMLEQYLPVKK